MSIYPISALLIFYSLTSFKLFRAVYRVNPEQILYGNTYSYLHILHRQPIFIGKQVYFKRIKGSVFKLLVWFESTLAHVCFKAVVMYRNDRDYLLF